jgi:hypothetical protein
MFRIVLNTGEKNYPLPRNLSIALSRDLESIDQTGNKNNRRFFSYRSEATMNTSRFTARYFPFPQPTSNPTEPGSRFCKKRSMMGQGFSEGEKKKEISLFGLYYVDLYFVMKANSEGEAMGEFSCALETFFV